MYEIEDMMAEARPGITYSDLMKMPFYEIMFKLDIIKRKAEERKKAEDSQSSGQNYKAPNSSDMMRQAQSSMPKMNIPGLPSGMNL